MKPRLLVTTDFAPDTQNVFTSAGNFARLINASITPFHSYSISMELERVVLTSEKSAIQEIEAQIKNRLDRLSREYVDEDLLTPSILRRGNADNAILEEAENYDWVVLGSKSRSGFARFLIGSTTEKVIRAAKRPVLTIGLERGLGNTKHIVVTTDFSDHSFKVFPLAADIARRTGAKITLLNIASRNQYRTEADLLTDIRKRKYKLQTTLNEHFADIADQVTPMVYRTEKDIDDGLVEFLNNSSADLVVMATIGRTGISYLTLGSVALSVLRHVPRPIITVNPKTLISLPKVRQREMETS